MPTISEYARARGVSHQYISKLVKKGLPLDSFELADLWREAHASSKAPTNPRQIAKQLGEEKTEASATARLRRKEYGPQDNEDTGSHSDDPLGGAFASAIEAQQEAWRLLEEAMVERKDSKILVRIAAHTRAIEALFKAAQSHREELQRRRILIPLSEAKDMARKGYEVIMSRLSALPQNMAPRCNPIDSNRAMTVLESECTAIIVDAQKVYASWSDDQSRSFPSL
jgi:hypothetical protein